MTIHTVQPGESVYSIAHLYKVPMERIIADNELRTPDQLAVGQTLVIRYPSAFHIVEPSDSLASIAAMHGMTITQLFQLNPQLNGLPHITPGQVLVLALAQEKQGTLAVSGYAYPSIDRAVLRKTLPYLTTLQIASYGFTADGSLLPVADEELISLAREYRVSPILSLTTIDGSGTFSGDRVHALLTNDAAQTQLLTALAQAMSAKGYDGVALDFEYPAPEDAAAYAAFVCRATTYLNPLGFSVTVALAPKATAGRCGLLYDGHDYAALGRAANAAMLMTYDYTCSSSSPGAISPMEQIRPVTEYAASVIPPDKLLLGLPNYGYDWALPHIAGKSVARALSNVEATDQAIAKHAEILYDTVSQAPHYSYWAGKIEHAVWFEDARSVRAKLALAAGYHLRGIGIWTIMHYFPQLFLVLSSLYTIEKRM